MSMIYLLSKYIELRIDFWKKIDKKYIARNNDFKPEKNCQKILL